MDNQPEQIHLPDPASITHDAITQDTNAELLTGILRGLTRAVIAHQKQIEVLQKAFTDVAQSFTALRGAFEELPNATMQQVFKEMERRARAN